MSNADYWLGRAQSAADRARNAEMRGDMELVYLNDDEYMRCLFNYYDAQILPTPAGDAQNSASGEK